MVVVAETVSSVPVLVRDPPGAGVEVSLLASVAGTDRMVVESAPAVVPPDGAEPVDEGPLQADNSTQARTALRYKPAPRE